MSRISQPSRTRIVGVRTPDGSVLVGALSADGDQVTVIAASTNPPSSALRPIAVCT